MEKYEALSQSATVDNAMQIETTREYIRELLNKEIGRASCRERV